MPLVEFCFQQENQTLQPIAYSRGEIEASLTGNLIRDEKSPIQDHCGILAAFSLGGDVSVYNEMVSALSTLQTRGYDGAGMCALSSDGSIYTHKGEGLISDVFSSEVIREEMERRATLWVAQTRYGTKGGFIADNVQPFQVNHNSGDVFFVAHNGQFSSTPGQEPTELSDTYEFAKELEQSVGETWDERILNTIKKKNGAYSLIIGTAKALYLIRDPYGVRPLIYGEIKGDNGNSVIVAASETVALDKMGATNYREVMPGTIVKFSNDQDGIITRISEKKFPRRGCSFENIYVASGESLMLDFQEKPTDINQSPTVVAFRQKTGKILAREAPLTTKEVDFAIGIPGTGIPGGQTYARVCDLPYYQAITDKTPQNDQRTFMSANVDGILAKVMSHFNFDAQALRGKKVVLIDDSIVRGNVMLGLIRLLKEVYGVAEVHVRILSPPIDKRCYLGINTRKNDELIAAQNKGNVEEIRKKLGADSLAYLSGKGLREAMNDDSMVGNFCMACMVGYNNFIDEFGNIIN